MCNLGNGGGFSIREVVAAAESVVGRPIPFTVGPRREGDPPVLVAALDARGGGPRLAAGAAEPGGDGRIGLGVAPAPPGRLPGLTVRRGPARLERALFAGAQALRRRDRTHRCGGDQSSSPEPAQRRAPARPATAR